MAMGCVSLAVSVPPSQAVSALMAGEVLETRSMLSRPHRIAVGAYARTDQVRVEHLRFHHHYFSNLDTNALIACLHFSSSLFGHDAS